MVKAQKNKTEKIEKKETFKPVTEPYIGSYIEGDLGGVPVSNPHLKKYYGEMIKPTWKSKT